MIHDWKTRWDFEPDITVADTLGNLCAFFCEAAMGVWIDLEDSQNCGAALSEDSITDYLLLNLRRRSPHLAYYRYKRQEEHDESGADWLWLFVSGSSGFPVLVQAKRLYGNLRYEALHHVPRKKRDQLNLLERHARENRLYPLICFYNFWPNSQAWATDKFSGEERLWGSAIAGVAEVKRVMRAGGNRSLSCIGPLSVPWHTLVCPNANTIPRPQGQLPDRVRSNVVQQFGGVGVPPIRQNLPESIEALLMEGPQILELRGDIQDSLSGIVVVDETRRFE